MKYALVVYQDFNYIEKIIAPFDTEKEAEDYFMLHFHGKGKLYYCYPFEEKINLESNNE